MGPSLPPLSVQHFVQQTTHLMQVLTNDDFKPTEIPDAAGALDFIFSDSSEDHDEKVEDTFLSELSPRKPAHQSENATLLSGKKQQTKRARRSQKYHQRKRSELLSLRLEVQSLATQIADLSCRRRVMNETTGQERLRARQKMHNEAEDWMVRAEIERQRRREAETQNRRLKSCVKELRKKGIAANRLLGKMSSDKLTFPQIKRNLSFMF